jgi:hypothetical protein
MHAFVRVVQVRSSSSGVACTKRRSFYYCFHQPRTDMVEDTEDIKPKLSLVINYEGTRQSSLLPVLAR